MKKEPLKIRKEFNFFIICLIIIFANVPVIILLSMFDREGKIQSIIMSCEAIMMGIALVYTHFKTECNEYNNIKKCQGTIIGSKFKLFNGSWYKKQTIEYEVDGNKYKIKSKDGINGLIIFFMKGKKIDVYYDEKNPKNAYTKSYIIFILGIMFGLIGTYILFNVL